jgi:hypothetical protein
MTQLPADPVSESRRGARRSVAIRIRAALHETSETGHESQPQARPAPTPGAQPRGSARAANRRTAHDVDRYANAGPDCYWPERG